MKKLNGVFNLFVYEFLNFYIAAGDMRSFCIFLAAIGTRPSQNLPWRPKSSHVTEGGRGGWGKSEVW